MLRNEKNIQQGLPVTAALFSFIKLYPLTGQIRLSGYSSV